MSAATILALLMLGALVIYALLAGADYGAGFWELFCFGPRQDDQRHLIAQAIEPVWETNHVWLILIVVLMFSGFPIAFGAIGAGLGVPLFLILLGILLRGSSFVFRAYFTGSARTQFFLGRVFSISSVLTPIFLGIVIGAVSSDSVVMHDGISENGFLRTWFHPFAISVGVLSLSVFAYLAACYLTLESHDRGLQESFRMRAIISGLASFVVAIITFGIAGKYAKEIRDGLLQAPHVWLIEVGALIAAIVAFQSLWTRHYRRARLAAAAQVSLIVIGWGMAQFPYLVRPDITIAGGAAPNNVLFDLELACAAGSLVLFPSLGLLFHVFKDHRRAKELRHGFDGHDQG